MKEFFNSLSTFLLAAFFLFSATTAFAQTPMDTVKPGKANDEMTINPGNSNDGMAVKPAKPNDGMSVMTDTGFLAKNIMDNMMEIEMAKMGRDKGTTQSIKKVASLMITDHTAFLNDLKRLSKKQPKSSEPNMKGSEPIPMEIPQASDFDQAWASQMLTIHEAKIAELESFIGLTKDAELKAAVMKALPKIKAHRDLLSKIPGAKDKAGSSTTI